MGRIIDILTISFRNADEKDSIIKRRLGFRPYTVGPNTALVLFAGIIIIFLPIFGLEYITRRCNLSTTLHDNIYLFYVLFVFTGILWWGIGAIRAEVRRKKDIQAYAAKRKQSQKRTTRP